MVRLSLCGEARGSGGGGGETDPQTTPLSPPSFSMSSGSYPITDYDLTVEINNPNPSDVSELLYKVDGGAWTVYGGALTVGPATQVMAFARSVDEAYTDSGEMGEYYEAGPVPLDDPAITASKGHFDLGNHRDVEVSMIEYRVDDGGWDIYAGPFTLHVRDHQTADANIEARAATTVAYHLESDTASDKVKKPYELFDNNGTIYSNTVADSVQLLMDLDFYDSATDSNFTFTIDLLNTVNTSDAWASADYVHMQNVHSDTTEVIQSRNYRLKLEFGETTSDGFYTIDEFHVLENSFAMGSMYATLWMDDLGE